MHIDIMVVFAIIVCVALIIWGVPKLPAPWNWVAVACVVAIAILGLLLLLSGRSVSFG